MLMFLGTASPHSIKRHKNRESNSTENGFQITRGAVMSPLQRTRHAAAVAALATGVIIGAPAIATAHPDAAPHYHVWNDPNNSCPAGQNEWNVSFLNFQLWAMCTN